ncbi:hypothetical protein LDENG_00200020 [Lucifuga dentata]|nr:hypothetical protein LDENG_00200020 [Lucifuga dentata]
MLQEISADLASLDDIRCTTVSVEGKLSLLISRLTEVEKRVEWLEDADKSLKASWEANPVATKAEVDVLHDRLEEMENRNRRNNLQLVGIPEGHKAGDIVKFIGCVLKSVLGGDDTTKLPEIEMLTGLPYHGQTLGTNRGLSWCSFCVRATESWFYRLHGAKES